MRGTHATAWPLFLLITAGAPLAACSACSESAGNGAGANADAGPDDAPQERDGLQEVGKPDAHTSDAPTEAADAHPDGTPPGWEPWTGWSPQCPLYVPGADAELPPPIEWEPCEEPIPQSLTCQQMKVTWNDKAPSLTIPKMDTTGATPLLQFSRVYVGGDPNIAWRLIAEPDGSIRSAFLQVNAADKNCVIGEEELNEGRYLYFTLTDQSGARYGAEGFLANAVGFGAPKTVLQQPTEQTVYSNWSMSKDWIVQRMYTRTAWSWDLQTKRTVYDAADDPEHLQGKRVTVIGADVFVAVGDCPAGVMTWDEVQGLRPLIRWFGDGTRCAGNFKTDGKDMVWTQVEGPLGNQKYEKMDVMTAPYTTDASQLQPRRLRSDVKAFDPDPWTIGCGYAARGVSLPDPYPSTLFIVRLADGLSWLLPGDLKPPTRQWGPPLGITCDEIFTWVDLQHLGHIVRIRLDSLGPGTPPD